MRVTVKVGLGVGVGVRVKHHVDGAEEGRDAVHEVAHDVGPALERDRLEDEQEGHGHVVEGDQAEVRVARAQRVLRVPVGRQ